MATGSSQPQALPLSEVVLYTSGVGYFQRDGTVDGRGYVELRFKTDRINDLLKSLIVQDLDGGQIAAVTYESRDPITKTLKTFSVDLTSNLSLGDLLTRIRGEQIDVATPSLLRGVIVANQPGVDDQVIKQRVVDVGVKIFFEVALAAQICAPTELAGLGFGHAVGFVGTLDALFQRGDQADVKHIRQPGRDDVAAAPDEDDIAEARQFEDGFGGLADYRLRRWIGLEQVGHDVFQVRNAVLGQKLGQARREVVVFQHLFHEIAVEHRPRTGVFGRMFLKVTGQFFSHHPRAAAGLPRNRHRAPDAGFPTGLPSRLKLAADKGRAMFNANVRHNRLR